MELMKMLKELLLGRVKLLLALTVIVVLLCMLDVGCCRPVSSSAKMAMMSSWGGKVRAKRGPSALGSDIVERTQEST